MPKEYRTIQEVAGPLMLNLEKSSWRAERLEDVKFWK